jgi:hypothetical protein
VTVGAFAGEREADSAFFLSGGKKSVDETEISFFYLMVLKLIKEMNEGVGGFGPDK